MIRQIASNTLLLAVFCTATALTGTGYAQDCDEQSAASYPGTWKKGMPGTVKGLSAEELARQKEIVSLLLGQLQTHYTPKGYNVSYSEVYGYPNPDLKKYEPRDKYSLSLYMLPIYCRNGALNQAHETSFVADIGINAMPCPFGFSFYIPEQQYDIDPRTEIWGTIGKKPVQVNGIWLFEEDMVGGFGINLKRYTWLITRDGTLPIRFITKKEYCQRMILWLEKSLAKNILEQENSTKKITDEEYRKYIMSSIESEKDYTGKRIALMRGFLNTASAAELNQIATTRGGVDGIFSDLEKTGSHFPAENESYFSYVVEPDPQYFDPVLPRHTPQTIAIEFKVNEKIPRETEIMHQMLNALDTDYLRNLIGNREPSRLARPSQPGHKYWAIAAAAAAPGPVPANTAAAKPNTPVQEPKKESAGNAQRTAAPAVEAQPSDLKFVYDVDSNRYNVVLIGNQYWMKENLRTSRYNDTTAIATGLNADAWGSTTNGAYDIYESKPGNKAVFGLLYNGYAATSGRLCPPGWRIPSDADWKKLEAHLGVPAEELDYTGGRGTTAGKVKAPGLWNADARSTGNDSGLSVLPSGSRNTMGEYLNLGQSAGFWTSTTYETSDQHAWYRHFNSSGDGFGRIYVPKNNGFSCRCILDK